LHNQAIFLSLSFSLSQQGVVLTQALFDRSVGDGDRWDRDQEKNHCGSEYDPCVLCNEWVEEIDT
jgi:hypothetical protein